MLKPAEILLPSSETNYEKWAVLACDQFTSEPEYWQKAKQYVANEPSTLNIIFPEVFLEDNDAPQRIANIQQMMKSYEQTVLTKKINGYIYVERDTNRGELRKGIVGAVDLEDYSFEKGAKPLIRPSENTVVERIPPRLAVRRGASLELPHIMMLIDDDKKQLIEGISGKKAQLELVYDTPLMLGGGSIKGWAITDPKMIKEIEEATNNIAKQDVFNAKYPKAKGEAPIAFAVGDGIHSLATAKAYWNEVKASLAPEQQQNHPARYCLVELVNIHSEAIEIEPIHRVVFGADETHFINAAKEYFAHEGSEWGADGEHEFVIISGGKKTKYCVKNPIQPLAVGSIQAFLDDYTAKNKTVKIDYIHGTRAVEALSAKGNIGIILPDFAKADLFKGVVLGGVLPRKTFSMGHAEEKRYYMECRKISL